MNPAVATVVVAAVAVIGTIIGAMVSSWLNRDKDDADTSEKISAAWDPVFRRYDAELARMDAKCSHCETRLEDTEKRLTAQEEETRQARAETRKSNAVLRKLVRALDTGDQVAHDEAIAQARELV
ncbi:hypothetical protein A5717_25900 [Mycolicibacterium porcinum]|uniref:hypothetical protein n=1 Tax=Mycolicibacterium porcinum TaxID=39693 RepID=UPI00080BCB0D|nr:hypothetical protein [Mycolicibacterium porcinum]OCB09212.1 hypothetical protein A5717_25900 [Mycolicibacterium porcinum]